MKVLLYCRPDKTCRYSLCHLILMKVLLYCRLDKTCRYPLCPLNVKTIILFRQLTVEQLSKVILSLFAAGVCECGDGYSGEDCSVDLRRPPIITERQDLGLCDKDQKDCSVIVINGFNFLEDASLTCVFQSIQVLYYQHFYCQPKVVQVFASKDVNIFFTFFTNSLDLLQYALVATVA